MENINPIELAQLPIHAGLIIAVYALWRENKALRDRYLHYLEERAKSGDTAAQKALNGRS